jgi:hypothetical protein
MIILDFFNTDNALKVHGMDHFQFVVNKLKLDFNLNRNSFFDSNHASAKKKEKILFKIEKKI